MSYNIIPITEKHIEAFWNALDSVAREKIYIAFLEGPPIETTRKFIHEQIENDMPHFVALAGDVIIGWCSIASIPRPVFAHSGVLGMGIIASHRGKGIGKALMQATLDKAKERGLTRIELELREDNITALELYKKFGFEVEGLKRNATKIDGHYSNDLIMGLLFEEAISA
jgi:ribosomal protein S18 acetylase RimI-like enzyme